MSELQLYLTIDFDSKKITGTIKNIDNTSLTVGIPTLLNLKFGQNEVSGLPVRPWISTHVPNSDGPIILDAMQSINFEYDYLKEYEFPGPGKYTAWFIYDSLGFKKRFAGGYGPHAGLDSLDEFRCKSSEIVVEISESDYEYNIKNLRRMP